MKGFRVNQLTVWIVSGLALVTSSVWAQTVSPIQNGQVEISGALPRTGSGAVDIEALKQTVQAQFARPGVQEVQFRNVALTEAEQRALFLSSDPNKNLLRQVSSVVPSANGAERNVTFRSGDVRVRVGREEGQLRARIEGVDQSQLTEAERQSLRAQFDRLRLDGAGNQADIRGGRGGSDNSGPGSGNSGHGSDNRGPGSANSGSGHGGRDDVRHVNDDRRVDRREDRQLDHQADRREARQLDRRADRASRSR